MDLSHSTKFLGKAVFGDDLMYSVLSLFVYLQIEKKWLEKHVGPDSSIKREEHESNDVCVCMVESGISTCIGDSLADQLKSIGAGNKLLWLNIFHLLAVGLKHITEPL